MSTRAKIAANTANAQHSTGPRTAEGKARSAQNSQSHGLTSKDLVVAEHEIQEFDQFQSELHAELCPQGPLETGIFHQLVHAGWNLRRIRRMESDLFRNQPDLLLDDAQSKPFERLARYQVRTERAHKAALKELRELQTNRILRSTLHPVVGKSIPPLANIETAKRTQKSSASSNFGHGIRPVDSQTPEFLRASTYTIPIESSRPAGSVR